MKKLPTLLLSLTAVFGLTACENAQDVARKPDVAEAMIRASTKTCADASTAGYTNRLRDVLMDTSTKRLETLQEKDITVCLDQRLSRQTLGSWDKRMLGGYYNTGTQKILSLYDNGKSSAENGMFELGYQYYSSRLIRQFSPIANDDTTLQNNFMGAARYGCGKNCTTVKWRTTDKFDPDTLAKNPALKNPPIR